MREQFQKVLSNYLIENKKPFTQNYLANFIRHDLVDNIISISNITEKYLVTGSAGQGNWAEIPWICVFDRDITSSAQDGYYIVYLFNSQMKGIYLSLNQGWTQYEANYGISIGRDKIKENADSFKSILRSTLNDFYFDPINLDANNTLGKGYELGHICGNFYPRDDIPDDNNLVNDLRNLIGVYREIKGIVGKDIFNLSLALKDGEEEEIELTTKEKLEINRHFTSDDPEDIRKTLLKLEEELKNKDAKTIRRMATAIARNKRVSDLVKKEAGYICSICGYPGLEKKNGQLFAEAHHKEELAISLKDLPSNIACVCPTCHRIIHYGNEMELNNRYI